jgi:Domain of unknown function (DUF4326)
MYESREEFKKIFGDILVNSKSIRLLWNGLEKDEIPLVAEMITRDLYMNQVTIGNIKNSKEGIRCDRVSYLGNPFGMTSESDRSDVIQAFAEYFKLITEDQEEPSIAAGKIGFRRGIPVTTTWKRPTSRQFLNELNRIWNLSQSEDITLLCWCAPLQCHCNVLKEHFELKNRINS